MKPLRVAHISYLNSAPFFAGMEGEEFELVDLHPRALGQAAEEGHIDAGLMSIADTFRNARFEPLGDLGIALDGPAHSVLLFSARPVEQLSGATIGVSSETSTSYPLLRLLLDGCFGVFPAAYVRRPDGPEPGDDGILLIGDAALRRAARSGLVPGSRDYAGAVLELGAGGFIEPFPHVLDLSAAWKAWQRLPFVFARWMVRRELLREQRVLLVEALLRSLDTNLRRLEQVAAEHAARAGISPEAAYAYLMGFTYRFGEPGEKAIRTFRNLLESTQWWETAPPQVVERGGV
jgi:chorismate dehydratase